ncbi:superoxide dismutase [Cephaloticoccus primus]|uniref:Superoxide dismutase n=1 Tax=Cephaloticoccus primus TaxID=1548207 RepID=A0A139SSZ2_9BACT|nr:superoxide dismutase [Cephaloticoccus primus]KXU37705.1 superoxide dismutase [Cephaloticoccus primus]
MAYKLPELEYATDALEPYIDRETVEIHHGKHHQTYVNNLNAILEGAGITPPDCLCDLISNIGDLPEAIRTPVRNNGGGVANHNFYWKSLAPAKGGAPTGALAKAIDETFGSFEKFKEEFSKAGATRFGSGWAWLYLTPEKKLAVGSTANQDNPRMGKAIAGIEGTPLLTMDVWEHSYYLKYQNRRPDYIGAFWNVVNWDRVAERYAEALAEA